MADEGEQAQPLTNAVRRQRALGAIRMRPIYPSWLAERSRLAAKAAPFQRGVARKPTGR